MKRFALVAVLLITGACGTPSGPDVAVESYFSALEAGDCAGAREVVLRPSELDCTTIGELEGALAAEGIDLADASFTTLDVVNDSATVEISWGVGAPETVETQRVDGEWLVVMDTAA